MISLDEARTTVLAGCRPLAPRQVAWRDVELGQILAADVVATDAVPPFANTAMDGYAVRAADVATAPVRLPVVAEIGAGHPADRALRPGEAMRIFTGAPIPDGADAVVIVEHTTRVDGTSGGVAAVGGSGSEPGGDRGDVSAQGGAGPAAGVGPVQRMGPGASAGPGAVASGELGLVEIHEPAVAGAHIRPPGDDIRAGDVVVRSGDELTPGRLGIVRTVGVEQLLVHPRPRVGVLSTGDELVQQGRLGPGQIYDSNLPTLLALVTASGGVPVDLGHAGDDEAAITDAITRGIGSCDLVLSTGGVSMGDTDLVKVVLDRLAGADPDPAGTERSLTASGGPATVSSQRTAGTGYMRWMQVAIRPAKPLAFGVVGAAGVPVIGLPGNPVSSMVSFELFARPALRRLAGYADDRLIRTPVAGRAGEPLSRRPDGKVQFVRVVARCVDGELVARSAGGQGSHQLSAMARANALAVLPDGPGVETGDRVDLLVFGEL
ncbi:MAG: molybdopterin molybdotransferase MoeA [Acidimicrobiales bacterium]